MAANVVARIAVPSTRNGVRELVCLLLRSSDGRTEVRIMDRLT